VIFEGTIGSAVWTFREFLTVAKTLWQWAKDGTGIELQLLVDRRFKGLRLDSTKTVSSRVGGPLFGCTARQRVEVRP
jgi:hypothetical protein